MPRANSIARKHAVTIVLLVLTLIYASEISSIRSLFDEGFVSTRFLPKLLVWIAIGALTVIALRDARASSGEKDDLDSSWTSHVKPLVLLGVVFCYIALFRPAGFILTTIALAMSCLWLFDFASSEQRKSARIAKNLIAALIITALAYLLFAVAFGTRLPLLPELN